MVNASNVGSTRLISSAAGTIDSKEEGTRKATVDVNPPSPRSITNVQERTARKMRENQITSAAYSVSNCAARQRDRRGISVRRLHMSQ